VVLVVSRLKAEGADVNKADDALTSGLKASLNGGTSRPPRIQEEALLNLLNDSGKHLFQIIYAGGRGWVCSKNELTKVSYFSSLFLTLILNSVLEKDILFSSRCVRHCRERERRS